jgi:hypothetical protein
MATKQEHTEQNFSFHRKGENGRVIVSNSLSYTMAEYDEFTGLTRWHRVVPAAQREKIQLWLLDQYPMKVAVAAVKNQKRRAPNAS